MTRLAPLLLAIAAVLATAAEGQSASVSQAIGIGQVGERFDGYLGFVATPSPVLRRQVSAINIQRRKLYIALATRRNVTAQLVGMATACQLLSTLPTGGAYMLNDGVWRHRNAGQAPKLPDYCR
jgi:uncharacterized protein YdbL (DUF1318 family)